MDSASGHPAAFELLLSRDECTVVPRLPRPSVLAGCLLNHPSVSWSGLYQSRYQCNDVQDVLDLNNFTTESPKRPRKHSTMSLGVTATAYDLGGTIQNFWGVLEYLQLFAFKSFISQTANFALTFVELSPVPR